ncbi:energy transducer TonB, partial [Ideonella sp.]|uniref:energy transducer TonB n=1 Tax=Ideonella sp. TaxID=1929293 RepID=UPI003BB7DDE1
LLAHLAAAWGLMQLDGVRAAMVDAAPIMVHWITPPAQQPQAPTPPPPQAPSTPPRAVPLIAAAPAPSPSPSTYTAALAPAEATPAPSVSTLAGPAAPQALPEAPAGPRQIPASALRYLTLPQQVYPASSRRLGEQGTVYVKVVVDTRGMPRQVMLHQSSGHPRLDEQALTAMRAARFQPYTDNGVAVESMAIAPLAYELD